MFLPLARLIMSHKYFHSWLLLSSTHLMVHESTDKMIKLSIISIFLISLTHRRIVTILRKRGEMVNDKRHHNHKRALSSFYNLKRNIESYGQSFYLNIK